MANIKTATLTPAAAIKPATRVVLLDEVTGNVILNAQMSELITFLTPFLGSGGGGGGGGLAAPVMPDTKTITVPDGRPDGSYAGYVVPLTLGSPAPAYSMTPVDGLVCRADTGDFKIVDRTAFFAAVALGATTTLTAANSEGFDNTLVTFASMPDFADLGDEAFYPNCISDWDPLDNTQMTYNVATNLVTLFEDKSPEDRDLTNAQESINYALNSSLGIGKPALRGTGAAGATSGLFFYENPLHWGIRNLSFSASTTNDRIRIFMDDHYFISPSEDTNHRLDLDFPKNSMINRTILLTIIWTTTEMRARIWGAETLTVPIADDYNRPVYPGMAFVLFYANAASGTIWATSAVGQGRSWKGSAFNGDMGRLTHFLNVVEPA